MSVDLDLLLIADREDDAFPLIDELRKGGFNPIVTLASTPEALNSALDERERDVILADYRISCLNGLELLRLAKERKLDTPFILVADREDERSAVEAMRDGAHDYVLRDSLFKLTAVVERELSEIKRRREHRAAEESLIENRRLLESIQNSLAARISVLDSAGNIIAVNDAWKVFAQESGDPFLANTGIGVNYLDVCRRARGKYSEGAMQALNGIQSVMQGELDEFEMEYICPYPTETHWFTMRVTPLRGAAGAVVAHVDITQHMLEEVTLERYRILSKYARDIILFLMPDGRIVEANETAVRAYGYTLDELKSMRIHDLRVPDARTTADEDLKKGNREGLLMETMHLRKDGSVFPVEVNSRGATIGRERFILSIIRDVTDRKKAELAFRESRLLLETITDNIPIGLITADAETETITYYNPGAAELLGGPVTGNAVKPGPGSYKVLRPDGALFPLDELPLIRALRAGERTSGVEMVIRRRDGSLVSVMAAAVPITDDAGRIVGAVASMDDITELVRLRQDLERYLEEVKRERDRVSALAQVAEAGVSTLELQRLLDTLVEKVATGMSSNSAHILVIDESAGEFVVQAVHNVPSQYASRMKVDEGFAGIVYETRGTVYLPDVSKDPRIVDPYLKEYEVRSILGTPITIHDKFLGVLYVDTLKVQRFSRDDRQLLEAMATVVANALENTSLYNELTRSRNDIAEALDREHYFSLMLQRALLPSRPTINPNYVVAAEYIPVYVSREIGGDFYDVFRVGDNRAGVLIGDVSGKGLEAAAMAATTRSTIHAFVHESASAAEALERSNAVLYSGQADIDSFVTVFLAIIDLNTCELNYSCAGHPPSAICRDDGQVEFLQTGQLPLAVLYSQIFVEHRIPFNKGDKLVLYTDGISEARRGLDMLDIEGIADILHDCCCLSPSDLASEMVNAATEWANGKLSDDAAVVVVQRIK